MSKNNSIYNTPGLKEVLANVQAAHDLSANNDSVNTVVIVSGNKVDKENFEARLALTSSHIFNSDNSTFVLSLQEKTGKKTREGNFLGTLLAYRYLKKAAAEENIDYRDFVTLVGMLFGRGERMSPITQAKGCRKPGTEVSPANVVVGGQKKAFTAIEEALHYFTPVAKHLERCGFRGLLDKWGDETEIPSADMTASADGGLCAAGCDIIKILSVMEITEELAKQKDWVVFDDDNNMACQISRSDKDTIIEQLKQLGIKPRADGKYYAGVSLGPVAVSYDVLDIALEVFEKEIAAPGVYFDFDPYFLMALAMENDLEVWQTAVSEDDELRELIDLVPDFFEKVQKVKQIFEEKNGRKLGLKIFDLGANAYWADVGQHSAMREKFLDLNDKGANGIIARRIAGIPEERDPDGNIIVDSHIAPGTEIKDSIIVGSSITSGGTVTGSVIIDSEFGHLKMNGAFAVRSVRPGSTVLPKNSGLYDSLGMEELVLEEGMRHVSVLTEDNTFGMKVTEETDLRDKDNTYNVPILGNDISFDEAYNLMFGVSMEELDNRRREALEKIDIIKMKTKKYKPLKFGTSGLRDKVENMTDMECYINTRGFISFLKERGEVGSVGSEIAIGGDRRGSTPRIIASVAKAIEDEGCSVAFCGSVPTPTLAYYAITNNIPSIMVTGSHIPDDRNGIKFNKKSGEVLKTDEADILKNVAVARNDEYATSDEGSLFSEDGMFKKTRELPPAGQEKNAIDIYIRRYLDVFPADALKGRKIVLYQHSAVGRDIIKDIFEGLGADVVVVGRSEEFIPVDTEKVSEDTRNRLKGWAAEYSPFALISTDGDSDRPLLADESGEFLTGDKLGALVSVFLSPDFAAVPISANDAVVSALGKKGIRVTQTKIGSPYVVAAMNEERAKDPSAKVVSWESNGGFLLGSDWKIENGTLKALPTRDAVLPLLSAIMLAVESSKSVSEIIDEKLPPRYTHADVVDDKTPGCEKYTAEMGKRIVSMFSPKEDAITQADYTVEGINSHRIDGSVAAAGGDLSDELASIKDHIARYFTAERGFSDIVSVNFIDGIRIGFANNDVSHLRPSGNAPEFRNYATADTEERADEIVEKRKEIVPQIVSDMLAENEPRSVGAQAAKPAPGSDTTAGRVLASVAEGKPLYLKPYKDPKVWGAGGIGEYWYGSEEGDKSSIVEIEGEEVPMSEITNYAPEDILGKGVIDKFGHTFPLVKILTPKGRLSVQFHDTKNELWIVTGVDETVAGGDSSIILGFSPSVLEKYGKNVNAEYKKALQVYGKALNELIDILEKDERGVEALKKTGNAESAADMLKDEMPQAAIGEEILTRAQKELDDFYNYILVTVGDVIPVPSGTLHALGAGVQVVEPQIPGETQSMEDGATYPVRYYFPGCEREGSKKELDIDRTDEIKAEVVVLTSPEILRKDEQVKIERLPGDFEEKGLEVHRISLKNGAHMEVSDIKSFHNLVVVGGEATVAINDRDYSVPQAVPGGEVLIIPAVTGKYTIKSAVGAQIIDTFIPV
ncbi:MAG: hypothetical protein P9L88_04555 [Candidatus Tantalella remota]|nr:hypothetical protein [Candidatus Tantalella remota]